MATIQVRDAAGAVVGDQELPEELFGGPVNVPLMHQIVVAGAAAQRAGTHSTKTRGDVRGGGVKPWRQKGTGRARQGSIRAPHWTGGGVAHGPKPHSHEMRVNRKMKKGALRSALADALASGKLALVDTLSFEEARTKSAVGVLRALELDGHVLIVLSRPNTATEKSFRNLRHVRIDYPGNLTTFDLLYADRVLFTRAALQVLTGSDPDAVETVVEVPAEPKKKEAPSRAPRSRRTRAAQRAETAQEQDETAPDEPGAGDDAESGDVESAGVESGGAGEPAEGAGQEGVEGGADADAGTGGAGGSDVEAGDEGNEPR
jgi:large subunit ribosomal protein L4